MAENASPDSSRNDPGCFPHCSRVRSHQCVLSYHSSFLTSMPSVWVMASFFVYKGGFQFHLRMLLLQRFDESLRLVLSQHQTHGRKSITDSLNSLVQRGWSPPPDPYRPDSRCEDPARGDTAHRPVRISVHRYRKSQRCVFDRNISHHFGTVTVGPLDGDVPRSVLRFSPSTATLPPG